MDLDIIIPAYNCEKMIKKTINSILKNNTSNVTITIVDDGSTDNTYKIISDSYAKNENIKLFSKTNGGPSSARHYGTVHSKGDYLWYVDAGDEINDGAISEVMDLLRRKKPDILIFNYLEKNSDDVTYIKQNYIDSDLTKSLLLNNIVPGVCMKIFKRNPRVLDRFLEIQEIWFGEDMCFSIMFSLETNNIIFIQKPYYVYVRDGESLTMKSGNPKDITTLDSINHIKYSLECKNKFENYKDEFEYMCFTRIIINSILLSSNSKYFKQFFEYFDDLKINKKNKYIHNVYWIYYLSKIKACLPFQPFVTVVIKKIIGIIKHSKK